MVSGSGRSVWKAVRSAALAFRADGTQRMDINVRPLLVTPDLVGRTVKVHTGRDYVSLAITNEMVGRSVGRFVQTKKEVKPPEPVDKRFKGKKKKK